MGGAKQVATLDETPLRMVLCVYVFNVTLQVFEVYKVFVTILAVVFSLVFRCVRVLSVVSVRKRKRRLNSYNNGTRRTGIVDSAE